MTKTNWRLLAGLNPAAVAEDDTIYPVGEPKPEPKEENEECPDCKGKGEIVLFTSKEECKKCYGTGKKNKRPNWGWSI